jgi:flagellar protein FlbT
MALKLTLKPNEKTIIGGAVLSNGNLKNCNLTVENNVPVLRQKDILSEEDADTPCNRIYFVIQLMYIDGENLTAHHQTYWKLVRELLDASPSRTVYVDQINEHILTGRYYQALKLASGLINYEQEVLKHV